MKNKASADHAVAYILSFDPAFSEATAKMLDGLGIRADHLSGLCGMSQDGGTERTRRIFAIVDPETFDVNENKLSDILKLRSLKPEIPIVLICRNRPPDTGYVFDFRKVGDTSLDFPFDRAELATAISQALVNNRDWREPTTFCGGPVVQGSLREL